MKNLISLEIDPIDDINGSLKIASVCENEIGKLEIGDVNSLNEGDYAIGFVKKAGSGVAWKYPIKTVDQTRLSCFYLEKNASAIPSEMVSGISFFLKKACDGHKIAVPGFVEKNASEEARSNLFSPVVYSEEDGRYALGDKYPINSKEDVKTACAYFDELGARFEPVVAKEFCDNVIKAASDLGYDIPSNSKVMDYDSREYSNVLKVAFDRRGAILDGIYEYGDSMGDSVKHAYKRLYGLNGELSPSDFSEKLADIDRISGISAYWNKGTVDDPYRSTFKKVAMPRMIKVGNAEYSESQLTSLPGKESFKRAFSEDFVAGFKTDPVAVFNSLPAPDKKFIASMIEA